MARRTSPTARCSAATATAARARNERVAIHASLCYPCPMLFRHCHLPILLAFATTVATAGTVAVPATPESPHSDTESVRRPPPGNDDPPSVCQSRHPSTSGAIYDFDAPGFVAADLGSQPPGIVYYTRQNFLQYAYIGGKRCSNDFAWWVRTTARTGGPNYLHPTEIWSRPEHPHDNAAGTGSTNMGIDE